jgi:phage terminase large subunit
MCAPQAVVIRRNKVYVPLWADTNRFVVLIGGSGSGKSVAISDLIVERFLSEPGHNVLITRKVGDTNRFSTFQEIKRSLGKYGVRDGVKIRESDMTIIGPFGNTIIFRGLDDIEKIKSITFESGPLTDIWMEEASETLQTDFRQLNLRLRGRAIVPFRFYISFNPITVTHWLKAEFFDNPKLNATVLRSTYLDNRFLDSQYREELDALKTTDPDMYQVYALGQWGQIGDAAFPNVRYESCPYSFEDFDRVVIGQDFGFNHYNAIELIGQKDGRLYSFAELYVRQKPKSEIIQIYGQSPLAPVDHPLRCDTAEPASIEEWRRAGYNAVPANKGAGSVRDMLRVLRDSEWIIDPERCPGLAAEVRGAAYKKDRNGNNTEDIFSFHDDALAACRYAVEDLAKPAFAFLGF